MLSGDLPALRHLPVLLRRRDVLDEESIRGSIWKVIGIDSISSMNFIVGCGGTEVHFSVSPTRRCSTQHHRSARIRGRINKLGYSYEYQYVYVLNTITIINGGAR